MKNPDLNNLILKNTVQKKVLTTAALVALLFGLSACDNSGEDNAEDAAANEASQEQPQQDEGSPEGGEGEAPEMPEPDLGDVPEVVAEVNDAEISGEDYRTAYESQFMQQSMQAQMSGQEIDEEQLQDQVLNSLIGAELLVQQAEEDGYEPSEEEVDAELQELAEANGMESTDELMQMAQEQGTEEDELRADVQRQLKITHVIESLEVDEPTDEEVQEAYDGFTAGQPAPPEGEGEGDAEAPETPSLEELRPQIEEQLTAQKQNEAATAHVDQIREDADVQIHL
ncbi:SurA N-terminal domain-containing protein [Nesterenkonia massiliensis]|uniref:SurA N-terminal domain-containing protein n=1 Tax=Nesterenkonia massiliensis TaxID=1232429 RepID=A0ABT2HS36_9MICC|nr:SurA N-terminal domain-containing protein [Nesterenkonia massiliensis]MCT1607509.1 SurA N-terminal domain-containing protein [Nesterenkonia massiliensis]